MTGAVRAAPASHRCPAPQGAPRTHSTRCPSIAHAPYEHAQRDLAFVLYQNEHRFLRVTFHWHWSLLLPEANPHPWNLLKSVQWQPRLIWRPHAFFFFNYVIRKILLTVVLKPLETWKFHFPCVYSSSLTTCWFFYSFLLLGENPSRCNSLWFHFGISQNWRFLFCMCQCWGL